MSNHQDTIMIVEDNQVLREGLRDILSMEGFAVMTAAQGQDAMDQIKVIQPDLILSDISMPVMDGFELFNAVRSKPEWVTIPFVFLTARNEKADMLNAKFMGAEDYLVKPLSKDELLTAVRARLNRSTEIRTAQLHQAYEASLTVLANAIDVRDPYTRGHVERVTSYAQVLSAQIGLEERFLEQIRFGAILHDIGKIIIQESTLLKKSTLNEQEWMEMRNHPVAGAEMIKHIPYLAPAMPAIRYHHERWDGKGYAEGLAGAKIPLGARIVAVADSFDAMTIDRPYRTGLSLGSAVDEIRNCSGTQFDPWIVTAFIKAWEAKLLLPVWEQWNSRQKASEILQ